MSAAHEIKTKVREFLVGNFFLNTRSISVEDDTSLMEKGIVDSTGILEVVNYLQSDFGIEISDDEILPENLDTLNNVAEFIQRKIVVAT